jgi:hypothetical protein
MITLRYNENITVDDTIPSSANVFKAARRKEHEFFLTAGAALFAENAEVTDRTVFIDVIDVIPETTETLGTTVTVKRPNEAAGVWTNIASMLVKAKSFNTVTIPSSSKRYFRIRLDTAAPLGVSVEVRKPFTRVAG